MNPDSNSTGSSLDSGRSRIVVVNDDWTQMKLLEGIIRHAGYDAAAFLGAEEALAAMDPANPPALVVTDVDMPGIDGWGFCRLLRSAEYAAFNAVPIVVGSATFAGEEPARIASDLGAEAFVTFPVDANRFVELLQSVMRGERKRIPPRALVVDDESAVARLLAATLSGAGYRADVAHSLGEAVARVEGAAYEVAVIDYHLTDGNGDLLLDRLNQSQPDCVCIMITGDPDPELALNWMKRGSAAHVHKPFEPAYLLELVARARREKSLMRLPKLLEKSTRELRRSEEQLRKAERRARTVLESVPEGIVAADCQTRKIAFANETFCRMLGYGRNELMGLTPDVIYPDEELARALAEFEKTVRGGAGYAMDMEVRRKDGSTFHADVHGRVVELDGRDCVLAVFVDVTERKRAGERLLQAKQTYQDIFDSLTEAIYIQDAAGTFIDVNRGAAAIYGCTREELIGQNPLTVAAPGLNDLEETQRLSMEVFRTGHPARFDFWAVRKNGEVFPKEVIVNRGRYYGQDVLIATARDVTEKKKAEKELRDSQAVLSLFMKHSPIYTYVKEVTAEQSRVVMASENFERMIGIPGSKMAGKTMAELFSPEFAAKITADDWAVVSRGEILNLEEELNGQYYETIKFPIVREGKTLLAGYTIEVTEQKQAEIALRRRESYLRAIIENQPGLVWLKDAESRFLAVNTAFAVSCGRERPEDVAGLTDLDIWPRELAEQYRADDRRAMRGTDGIMVEETIFDRGLERWAETFKKPVFDETGGAIGTTGYSRDITERKRAAEELKSSEARFRSITENAFDMISLLDREGRYAYCNPSYKVNLGYDPGELTGRISFELVHPDDREMMRTLFGDGVRNRAESVRFTARLLHKNGETKWVEHRATLLFDSGGTVAQVLLLATDVTERKRLEEALDRRMVALSQPLDNPEGIELDALFKLEDLQRMQDDFAGATGVASIITRTDGVPITRPSRFTRFCNLIRETQAGCANCHRSDAVVGRCCLEGPTIQPCLSGGLWDAGAGIAVGGRHIANWLIGQVRDETQTENQIRAYARDIGEDEESLAAAFLDVPAMSKDQFENVARMLHTFAGQLSNVAYQNVQQARFIADRKRAEAERERLEAQLGQAQKMESIGRLAGGVAHDFNNMLCAILGFTELALDSIPPNQAPYAELQEIRKAAGRSADLTRQLLAFARKQTITPQVLDLNETVGGMLKMLRRLIGEHVELDWRPGNDVGPVKMDPTQIDQILANLCVNARDALGEGGVVAIETGSATFDEDACIGHDGAVPGDYVRLAVVDNGCGMDDETVSHVFEPFFTTKGLGQGTGLGLATVYGIVRQNNGIVEVVSAPGKGTTIAIYLPRHAERAVGAAKPETDKSSEPGCETILLVEDEAAILNMVGHLLERRGYRVVAAHSPGEAIRLAGEHEGEIDLLMTDVVMPGMTGYSLANHLRMVQPGLKCLYMSGHTADVLVQNNILGENVHFIQKPFSTKDLMVKLREALERE